MRCVSEPLVVLDVSRTPGEQRTPRDRPRKAARYPASWSRARLGAENPPVDVSSRRTPCRGLSEPRLHRPLALGSKCPRTIGMCRRSAASSRAWASCSSATPPREALGGDGSQLRDAPSASAQNCVIMLGCPVDTQPVRNPGCMAWRSLDGRPGRVETRRGQVRFSSNRSQGTSQSDIAYSRTSAPAILRGRLPQPLRR